MFILIGGLFLVISAFVLRWTRIATSRIKGKEPHESGFEFIGTVGLGVFMVLGGLIGLSAGFYAVRVDKFHLIILFSLASSINVQARLLNIIEMENNVEALSLMDHSNGAKTIKLAYSIGLFPRVGKCLLLIHGCQVIQAGSLLIVVFAVVFA